MCYIRFFCLVFSPGSISFETYALAYSEWVQCTAPTRQHAIIVCWPVYVCTIWSWFGRLLFSLVFMARFFRLSHGVYNKCKNTRHKIARCSSMYQWYNTNIRSAWNHFYIFYYYAIVFWVGFLSRYIEWCMTVFVKQHTICMLHVCFCVFIERVLSRKTIYDVFFLESKISRHSNWFLFLRIEALLIWVVQYEWCLYALCHVIQMKQANKSRRWKKNRNSQEISQPYVTYVQWPIWFRRKTQR